MLHSKARLPSRMPPRVRAAVDSSSLAKRVANLDLGSSSSSSTAAASRPMISPGAMRLVKAQQESLAGILRAVKAAGPENYVKNDHYAWWVWPTTKPGINDHKRTSCENATDVAHVLSGNPALPAWTELLEAFAQALRARRSRRVFPSIDHGRACLVATEPASQKALRLHTRRAVGSPNALDMASDVRSYREPRALLQASIISSRSGRQLQALQIARRP